MKHVCLAVLTFAVWLSIANPARAAGPCLSAATLDSSVVTCSEDADTSQGIASAGTDGSQSSGIRYQSRIVCGEGADNTLCTNPQYCAAPPGSIRHTIFRSRDGGVTYTEIGQACLLPEQAPPPVPPQVTPDLVAQAFATLTWPESPLTIQPPGGRTLVNLETNFLTTNTAPTTQSVQLLGQSVDIEATPSTWTWLHGDGTTQTTDRPGTPYPDLTVTHIYRDADTVANPSVDTTYTGRYRLNGGPWQLIPTTRTITGTPAELEIVPATPQLVAP